MKHLYRTVTVSIVSLLVFIAGLAPAPAIAAEDPVVQAPWLRAHLPDDALAYMRIPNVYGLFTSPKGNALDSALRSDANVRSVRNIRRGISDNVIPLIPAFEDPVLRLLERHLQSPIEIAVLAGQTPSAVLAVNLDLRSNVALEEMFGAMSGSDAGISLTSKLDANGVAPIFAGGLPAFIQFREDTGRAFINAGPAVSLESFETLLGTIAPNDDHGMHAMERRVDASGQGFFQWVNAARAVPMMQMMMQPEDFAELAELGIDKVSAVAVGWGVANGKGRLSFLADLPPDADRGLLPIVENKVAARSVGDPDGLMLISFPSAAEFSRIESKILSASEIEKQVKWLEIKSTLSDEFGFSFEGLLDALGPELLVIFDKAGDYSAIRLRDADRWQDFIDDVAEKTGIKPEMKRVGSKKYYSWGFSADPNDAEAAATEAMPWLAEIFGRRVERMFWTQDGDYLYMASVPQVLIDRAAMRPRTDIAKWLSKKQRIDVRSALVSFNGTSHKLPRRLYTAYIEVMQMLADIGQADFDIWSMPSPRQLDLPDTGTLGFTLDLGSPTLAAEFTFENNPGEMLGGVTGVAMVGVIAAIAIPAYQDYTIRAKVSEGLNLSGAKKAAIAEFYMTQGRFPGIDAAAELSIQDEAGKHTRAVIVEPETGRILIEFFDDAVPDGGQLFLEPDASDDYIEWSCYATLADKYVPAACRGGD